MDGKCTSRKGAGDAGEVNPGTKHDAHDRSNRNAKDVHRPAAMPAGFVIIAAVERYEMSLQAT